MLNYMSYENYASISSSKKIQSEPRVHRHQSSITKKENARREAGRCGNEKNWNGKYIYIAYHRFDVEKEMSTKKTP